MKSSLRFERNPWNFFESSYSAYSANALASLLLNLANYLIKKKELYLEALNFLQSINQLRKRKPILNTSISMQLEFMQVYALLGLNDKEGIYRAKQVMKALEGLIALENFELRSFKSRRNSCCESTNSTKPALISSANKDVSDFRPILSISAFS